MAAVGAEVTWSWFLSSGVSFFILLLLLSIFLTALCSDCRRRLFDLQDFEADRNLPTLISVVSLEEAMGARENPAINEIQNDEDENTISFTPWRSHLVAPQIHQDVQTNGAAVMMTSESETAEEENSVSFIPWRSHLEAPPSQDLNSYVLPDSNHIYHVIGGGPSSGGGDADVSSASTNHEPEVGHRALSAATEDSNDNDSNSMYTQISKKERLTTPPAHTPEEVQEEEEEEEEEPPPLPDRRTQLEG